MAGISFDEALVLHVGQFGHGQLKTVAAASSFWLPNAFAFLLFVFVSIDPIASHDWQCTDVNDQACAAVSNAPTKTTMSSQAFCQLSPDQWHLPLFSIWFFIFSLCNMALPLTPNFVDSLVARFSLVCGDAWKVQITNSILFLGCFIGSGVFGLLADKVGRRAPLFLATAVVAASTLLSLTAKSYWGYAVTRAVTGFGAAGQSQCIFLLSAEITGPACRGVVNIFSSLLFAVGEFLLVGLARALPNWRHLTIAAGVTNAAALFLWPLIPESARWLLSQGRTEEASALLRKLSDANGSHMPQQTLVAGQRNSKAATKLQASSPCLSQSADCSVGWVECPSTSASTSNFSRDDDDTFFCHTPDSCSSRRGPCSTSSSICTAQQRSATFVQLLRNRSMLLRSLVLMLTWFALLLTYYGIAMGSGGLPGSIYVTFTLGAAAELLAILVAGGLVDRAGRHNCVSLGLLLGGTACLACARSSGTAQAVLSAVGKFGCSFALAVCPTFTAELFPTCVRSTAMGVFNQAARCGSIAAPFLLMAGAKMGTSTGANFLPYILFGSSSVVAGLLVLLLPETLGTAMPETLEDMSALQSVFAARPWRQGCLPLLAFLFRPRADTAGTTTSSTAVSNRGVDDVDRCERAATGAGGRASCSSSGPAWCGPDVSAACDGTQASGRLGLQSLKSRQLQADMSAAAHSRAPAGLQDDVMDDGAEVVVAVIEVSVPEATPATPAPGKG